MYISTSEGLGQTKRTGNCAGWEQDLQSFSKVVAEHYVRSELGLPLKGKRIWCSSNGKLCEVYFSRDITIAVSFVKVPHYVIARQVYKRGQVPRCEYSYSCSPRGKVIFSRCKQKTKTLYP